MSVPIKKYWYTMSLSLWLRPGIPCLCLCGSLWLAVGASEGPVSTSLNVIITVVAAWTAAWFTISLMFSDSATFLLTFALYVCFF